MKRSAIRLAFAAWALAFAAQAAMLPATPATFAATLAAAQPGDTVTLADGAYPSLAVISRKGLKIVGGPGAVLAGFNVSNSTDIDLSVSVDNTPGAGATNATIVGRIGGSTNVRLHDCTLVGRPVPAGTPGAVLPANGYPYGLIVGFTQSRGLTIEKSSLVTVEGCEVTGFAKSIVVTDSAKVTLRGNRLDDMRTTAITGGGATPDLVIDRNVIGASYPWRTADDKDGDHLDAMHIFNVAAGAPTVTGVVITNNVIDQGDGYARLGLNIQGPYAGTVIDGNTLIVGDGQGAAVDGTFSFTNNVMLAPVGAGPKSYPTLNIRSSRAGAVVKGNQMADLSAGVRLAVDYPDNKWLPRAPLLPETVAAVRKAGLEMINGPVDPKDAVIADLKAQLGAARAANADLTTRAQALLSQAEQTLALLAKEQDRRASAEAERDGVLARAAALQVTVEAVRAAVQ